VVHLIRDPRAILGSRASALWAHEFLEVAEVYCLKLKKTFFTFISTCVSFRLKVFVGRCRATWLWQRLSLKTGGSNKDRDKIILVQVHIIEV